MCACAGQRQTVFAPFCEEFAPGLSAAQGAYPNERRPWTTCELKVLSTMRGESTDAAAAAGAHEKDEAPA